MPILTEQERIGTLLAGKYRVVSVLAQGGMGVLYTGTHTWTGRSVAIKLLAASHTTNKTAATRFLREGRAAANVRHPHVVEVLDMGQAEDGALFMVLELLAGTDLGRVRAEVTTLPVAHAVEVMTPIVDALATVHEGGFVHRDLKPANIFLARLGDGRFLPKLLDFGIAKGLAESGASGATSTGMIVGTPHYMAPEQATGTDEVGPAADVWALGVLFYELLAGCYPYDGPSPTAVLMAVLNTAHVPLVQVAPQVPPKVAALVESALTRDPAQRPSDLRAWVRELRAAAGMPEVALPLHQPLAISSAAAARTIDSVSDPHSPTDPPPPLSQDAPRPPARRRDPDHWPWRGLAAGAAIVLLVTIAIALGWGHPAEPAVAPLAARTTLATLAAEPDAGAATSSGSVVPVPTEVTAEPTHDEVVVPAESDRARHERVRRTGDERGRGRHPVSEITTEW